MGFERYVDYALDVPMYFVYRNGRYIDAAGASFRDFMRGRLAALPGERATLDDWVDHLTTLFPDVRLKRFLEMRGADAGAFPQLLALPALWVGLLYDRQALDDADDLDRGLDRGRAAGLARRGPAPWAQGAVPRRHGARRCARRRGVGARGLGAPGPARSLRQGREPSISKPLTEIVETGRSAADRLLADYRGPWDGDIDKVFATAVL